ncbi:MAG: histidinol-phosphate transaminase [Desulfatiglandaceae bacterium]
MKDQRFMNFPSIDYLESVETYTPGLRVPEVVEKYGVPAEKVAKLASAENPLGPSPRAVKAIQLALNDLSLYPDWQSQGLREAIARHNGVKIGQVIVSCGETELIPFIIRAFSEEGDKILFPIPTFPIYEQASLVERRQPVSVPMDEDFKIDPERLLHAFTERTSLLILTSPNNPLSTTIGKEKIRYILDHTPPEVLVLLDEAYVDYSERGSQADLLHLYPNLIVLRTFSKIYGLAGLRVGYGMASEVVIQALMKVKPTWNIGNLAAAGAAAALEDKEHYKKTRALVHKERDYLVNSLHEFSNVSVVMKPEANFLCLRIMDLTITSTDVFEGLLQGGVITKDCSVSFKGLGNRFIRVDVNQRSKMDQFLSHLARVMA